MEFKGSINLRYKVGVKTEVEKENYCQIMLDISVENPFSENLAYSHLGCKCGIGTNYPEALKDAITGAEKDWKLKLNKKEILKTA